MSMEPSEIPVVYYFKTEDQDQRDRVIEFMKKNRDIELVLLTDLGYFMRTAAALQPKA